MASILRATSTVGAKPLKSSSSRAKEVRGKLERLSKDNIPRGSGEEAPKKSEKAKEPRGKEKVPDDSHKKRRLVYVTSSSGKFGTLVSHSSKDAPPQPKLLDSAMEVVKVEMVRKAEAEEAMEEAVRRAAEEAKEEATKQRPAKTQGKSPNFLTGHDEVLALALLDALPAEVRGTTESFYKFWIDR